MSLTATLRTDTFAALILRSLERAGMLPRMVGSDTVSIQQCPTLEELLALDLPQDARDLSAALIDLTSADNTVVAAGVATLLRLANERSEWRYGIGTALAGHSGADTPASLPATPDH